jgi:sugar phosphate isomerase/epimerase
MRYRSRRDFLGQLAAIGGLSLLSNPVSALSGNKKAVLKLSLAEWSLHKTLFAKKMTNLDFPSVSKNKFGVSTVEYVNAFFKDKAEDTKYLNELLKRCKDNGVNNHLIMIDSEGDLAAPDTTERKKAIENHYKWVNAAKYLGCATIRVNAFGKGSAEEVQKAAIDGISSLAEYAAKENINVVIENHGGYSSNGKWLLGLMKGVNKQNVGMLPDFGNFCIRRDTGDNWEGKCVEEYDKYEGVKELLPYAKGLSAKTFDFDANGNCVETDYDKMMKIVSDRGFNGYIGIEYEGEHIREEEGIKKTKALLQKYLS